MDIKTKLYNPEIKERFLDENYATEESKNTARHVLSKAELVEDILQKDLYNFNLEEIEKVIKNANPHSLIVARSYVNYLSRYISWAISPMGLRDNNIHPIKGIIGEEWYKSLVTHTKKLHLSYDEFISILEQIPNNQDKAFLFLLFEGIGGKSFSQITVLKKNDLKQNENKIYISEIDDDVEVSAKCMEYLIKASEETNFTYHDEEKGYYEKPLLESEYVFRNIISPRAQAGKPLLQSVFYTRINNAKEITGLDYLTPAQLKQSGQIYYAYLITKSKIENGQEPHLKYADFAIIGDKYNATKTWGSDGSEYYNTSLMRQYINSDTLKELYGIDVTV